MSQYFAQCMERTATTERALALLLMLDGREAADGSIIVELASQLARQLERGDVRSEGERALVRLAVDKAALAFPVA